MAEQVRDGDETEIAAIFARLQAEVRGRQPSDLSRIRGEGTASSGARSRAEQTWSVTAERPFQQSPDRRIRAVLLSPIKRILRKLMRWYVEPLAAQQRSFNLAVLTVVDELAERIEELEERLRSEQSGLKR